jgi:hypothetical protein
MARGARREIGGHDLVAASDQGADQVVTDLAAGSGEEDLHEARIIDRDVISRQAGDRLRRCG